MQSDPIGFAGGLNSFSYALHNPLIYIDIFGLTQEDIDVMLKLAKETQSDLRVPDSIAVKDLGKTIYGDEIVGFTNPITKNILLDDRYLETLDCDQIKDLFEQIVHASIHRTKPHRDMIRRPVEHPDILAEAKVRAKKKCQEIERRQCGC